LLHLLQEEYFSLLHFHNIAKLIGLSNGLSKKEARSQGGGELSSSDILLKRGTGFFRCASYDPTFWCI